MLMPHEDLHRPKQPILLKDRYAFYKHFFSTKFRARKFGIEERVAIFNELVNGKHHGNLHDKYLFVETLGELGYRVPKQCLYADHSNESKAKVIDFANQHKTVLAKPKNGALGIGIFVSHSTNHLLNTLAEVEPPYIIQEYLPPIKDYRYLYHIGVDVIYRVCYEKNKPTVVGDGKSSLLTLILSSTHFPFRSKLKILRKNSHRLKSVPAANEEVTLVKSGNISQGAFGIIVEGDELNAIDKIVLDLINDLKKQKAVDISTYCFDIGSLKPLEHPDTVSKDDILFFEFQMPFKYSGYINSPMLKGVKNRTISLMVNSLQRVWIQRSKETEESALQSPFLGNS